MRKTMREMLDARNDPCKSWEREEVRKIPDTIYYKLLGEFESSYVSNDSAELKNAWIINEHSIQAYGEEKYYDERTKEICHEHFRGVFRTKKTLRRNVSVGLANDLVKDYFESRWVGATDIVKDLVERINYLTRIHALHLEPGERSVLLGILAQHDEISPVLIDTLAKEVLDSEYYKNEDDARSLYGKLHDATYQQLLGTVDSLGY